MSRGPAATSSGRRPATSWVAPRARLVLLVRLALAGTLGCTSAPPRPPEAKRLLAVTHTTGFRHSSIPVAEATLQALADEAGTFTVSYCRTADDVASMLTPAGLAGFDGVFFANTSGDLGIPDLDAFLGWIAAGHAFLGAHSASDTYHGNAGYLAMLGGEFLTHGNQTEVVLTVEAGAHPAVASLGSTYRVFDEIYELVDSPRSRATVLLSLDHHPDDGHPEAGQPGDFPIAWYRLHGQGRVFYTALGHREDVWESSAFRAHLRGAIRWALDLP